MWYRSKDVEVLQGTDLRNLNHDHKKIENFVNAQNKIFGDNKDNNLDSSLNEKIRKLHINFDVELVFNFFYSVKKSEDEYNGRIAQSTQNQR